MEHAPVSRHRSDISDHIAESAEEREEHLAMDVWVEKNYTEDAEFFDEITIDRSGGLKEVERLWRDDRWADAAIRILMLVSNLGVIIYMDTAEIFATKWLLESEAELKGNFLLTRLVTDPVLSLLGHLSGSQRFWNSGHAMPCLLELLGLAALLLESVYMVFKISIYHREGVTNETWRAGVEAEFHKWDATQRLFLELIPELSGYSAMRLLHFVHPYVLLDDLFKWYMDSRYRWVGLQDGNLAALKLVNLLLLRTLCIFVGVDVFIIKCRQNIALYMMGELSGVKLLGVLLFVMQVLGIVQVNYVLRQRLFSFIFAGEDSVLQPRETAIQTVWSGMLTRQVFKCENLSWIKSITLLLTFSNEDFQMLVLNSTAAASEDPERGPNGTVLSRAYTRRQNRLLQSQTQLGLPLAI